MECSVLGPVEVRVDGVVVDLGGPRQQLIVAGLLFHVGQVVTVSDLIELVWDERPPVTARNQLQTAVYRLRRLLGQGGVLQTDQAGYRLAIPVGDLDLGRFRVALAQARAAAGGEVAAEHYRRALDEWRGTPFAGLGGSVVGRWREVLTELRWAATEEWADTLVGLGRHREVVEAVAPLVAAQPLRERLAVALIAALHGDGLQAAALQIHQRTVAALRDELGVDPGPQLREVHLEVLRSTGQDAAVTPGSSALPRVVALLRGREAETARVLRAAHGGHRLVVVDGMAGVGKSAFTVSVATALRVQYPSAQLFVDLQGHSEAAPVAPVDALGLLLTQLGVAAQGVPQELAGRQALWWRTLAAQRVVVVLDNVTGAEQVRPLLPPGGVRCLVLVTSRTRIGPLDGAFPLSLGPLPVDDAVEVLRDAVGERVDAELEAAVAVVELCGRLPLAVRLVAHRLQHRPRWSLAALVERLRAADPPPIAVSAEGRSVAAAFDVSYRQLSEREQRCFRLLGLHPAGEFEVWPAAALAEVPAPQARELLDRLVEVHLLEEDHPGRYRMHDLMREFAATLVTAAERPAAVVRLLDYHLHTAALANRHLELRGEDAPVFPADAFTRPFPTAQDGQAWMRRTWSAVVALADEAHHGGAHRHAVLLLRVLWRFAYNEGRVAVTERLGRQAIVSAAALDDHELIALAHKWHAGMLLRLGRPADSIEHLHAAAKHYSAAGLVRNLVSVELNLGIVCRVVGRLAEGMEHLQVSLAAAVAQDAPAARLRALAEMGSTQVMLGRPAEGRLALREAVAGMYRFDASMQMATSAASEFGRAHLALGHPRLAVLLLRRAHRVNTEAGNVAGAAETLSSIGRAHAALGDLGEALRCQLEACEQIRDLIDPHFEPGIRNDLGGTLTLLGRTVEAVEAHGRALLLTVQTGQRYEEARAHAGLAAALRRDGRDDAGERARAHALFRECGLSEEAAALASLPAPQPDSQPDAQPALVDGAH